MELSITRAIAGPFGKEYAIWVEFLDAVVKRISNINVAGRVYFYSIWIMELSIACAIAVAVARIAIRETIAIAITSTTIAAGDAIAAIIVRTVANATRKDAEEFMTLAAAIPIQAHTTPYPLNRANEALADLKHSRINGEAVLHVV